MTIVEQITDLFPVRRSQAQKQAFRQWVSGEIADLGWKAKIEQNDKGRQQNLVVGDPEHAEIIFTAHYDTPANILLPDIQIPRNYPVYLLHQIAIIGGMLLLSLLAGAAAGLATQSGDVMILAFFGAFLMLMLVQIYGPANKNNVNDNTSGVAALLELMRLIPEEDRAKAAFILFDNMEKGRKGSKAYASDHLEVQHTRYVVNLDSVGVGETFVAAATSLAAQMSQHTALKRVLMAQQERDVQFHSSATTRGNSDHRSFKCGVGITAYRHVSGVGLYLGGLHTARDTQADQGNISCLAQALAELVSQL